MTGPIDNRTVAITEHRLEKEFASLIERHGTRVISCPLREERPVEKKFEVRAFIDRLVHGDLDFIGEAADSAPVRRGINARIYPKSLKMASLAQASADYFAGAAT